jgi:uncharacterized protein YqfB (UPF0267 family)
MDRMEVFTKLAMHCALACVSGEKTVTVSLTGKKPSGFPRGELLSVGTNGANNYAICPVKVMAWIHKTAMTHNSNSTT